jgi:hypothetical protein
MCLIEVRDYQRIQRDANYSLPDALTRRYCDYLEGGQILFLPEMPDLISLDERRFLITQQQADSQHHKNISYRPVQRSIRGFAARDPAAVARLRTVLGNFSRAASDFLARLLRPYAGHWKLDFASYRPCEEQGRDLPPHKRNDLLHVDAFPTRPSQGNRILRFFVNINPSKSRIWLTTRPFPALAEHFAEAAGLSQIARRGRLPAHRLVRLLGRWGARVGLPVAERSLYDVFMLRFHDYLKDNEQLQARWPKVQLEFPPGSAWITFTDSVPHAVLSGQFALEQTYIVPRSAMLWPERSPLRILERQCGLPLVDHDPRIVSPGQQVVVPRTKAA